MDIAKLRWIVGGAFLLALALFNFATYMNTASGQSTFNILSGQYEYVPKTESPGNSVTGSFQEGSGNPISFYIMNSAEYSAFQIGTGVNSEYSILNVPSANFAYTFSTQDQYYFVFRHGQGFSNTTETVSFQRSYTTLDSTRLYLGILFLIFAAVELIIAFVVVPRRQKNRVPFSDVPQPFPPVPFQPLSKSCKNCGQMILQSATFCPSCGTRQDAQ